MTKILPSGEDPSNLPGGADRFAQHPLDREADRQRSLDALAEVLGTFAPEPRPLHEQEWLWAEACAVPFRVQKVDPVWRQPVAWDERSAYGPWTALIVDASTAWAQAPLVWRVQDGVAQAVFLGTYRFTWSVSRPQGLCEVQDLGQGWAAYLGPLSWPDLCLILLASSGRSLPHRWVQAQTRLGQAVVDQHARHAQRHAPRLTVWDLGEGDVGGGGDVALSACPVAYPTAWPLGLGGVSIDRLAERFRAGLRGFVHALTRLDPFWRTVARVMWRRYPLGSSGVHQIESDPLLPLLAQWNAWKAVAAEHPRAHLLLGDAIRLHHLAPNMHTWRTEIWQAQRSTYKTTRAGAWAAVRHGPLAQVATALRLDEGLAMLDVLTLCQVKHVMPEVLRKVPEGWWLEARDTFEDHASVREAMPTFAVRRVRAFLAAAAGHPWVEQRMTVSQWLLTMEPVMEWLSGFSEPPMATPDPSWSWTSLVRAWMDQQATLSDWPSPLRPCFHRNLRLSVVSTDHAWVMLGGVMHNCLKDSRSDGFRDLVREGQGIMVRLSGRDTSAVLLVWVERNAPTITAYHQEVGYMVGDEDPRPGAWVIGQHFATHNTAPSSHHASVAIDLCRVLNATIEPGICLATATARRRLAQWYDGLSGLVDAIDPVWGESWPDSSPPSWRRPLARLIHEVNDDGRWYGRAWRRFNRWCEHRCARVAGMMLTMAMGLASLQGGSDAIVLSILLGLILTFTVLLLPAWVRRD